LSKYVYGGGKKEVNGRHIRNKSTRNPPKGVALQFYELNMQQKLSALGVGQKAIILSLEDEELVLKLMEMGFLPGEEVIVEQIAPLGDPISVMVAGYQVSLRISEADAILVEINT
jgi:ferrous iron transport protein A